MAASSAWVGENWFNLVQSTGIIASLCLAALSARREAKAQEIENLLTISEHHRALWGEVSQRRELDRVFQSNVDFRTKPITVAEEEFLNLVIVQYLTGWRIAKTGGITTLKELATDVADFFTLPLPHAVWEKTRASRNEYFVRFVELAIEVSGR